MNNIDDYRYDFNNQEKSKMVYKNPSLCNFTLDVMNPDLYRNILDNKEHLDTSIFDDFSEEGFVKLCENYETNNFDSLDINIDDSNN